MRTLFLVSRGAERVHLSCWLQWPAPPTTAAHVASAPLSSASLQREKATPITHKYMWCTHASCHKIWFTNTHTSTHTHASMHTCAHEHTHTHTHTHTHSQTHTLTWNKYTHAHTQRHKQVCVHARTHTHLHTHTNTLSTDQQHVYSAKWRGSHKLELFSNNS